MILLRQLFHQVVAISFVECEIHNDGNGEYYVVEGGAFRWFGTVL
jgi:hypothetical protein